VQVQLHVFPFLWRLPPSFSVFLPICEVEHTCILSIHANTQLSWLLSGTFQWWTFQTISTACCNVDVEMRSSSPAMLINCK
jgi:hypothetical protein